VRPLGGQTPEIGNRERWIIPERRGKTINTDQNNVPIFLGCLRMCRLSNTKKQRHRRENFFHGAECSPLYRASGTPTSPNPAGQNDPPQIQRESFESAIFFRLTFPPSAPGFGTRLPPHPMKKYNVGIVGFGWVATAHLPAIQATRQAQVGAVYSSRPQNADALSAKYGTPLTVYSRYEDLLSDPSIDVVSICSFPKDHADQAVQAAKAGKHIILEKPMALSWEDCLRIEKAVREAGVQVCVCFECRYSNQFLSTRAVLDQGLLGTLHYAEVDYYHGIGPWYGQYRWNTRKNQGGSALLTAGCHALDALLLFMQGEVESVTSLSTQSKSPVFSPYEYHTTSVSLVRFRDGRIGKCAAVVDCLQPYYFHTHLVGSEGSLLDNKIHSSKLLSDKAHWSQLSMKLLDSGDVSDHPYTAQFQAFFDALDEQSEMPLTGLTEALRTHRVLFAADASASSGKPVQL
jgi:UDP-N-acetyl-2-amino-2-deoxyglucuronate dehydrogenase